MGLTLQEYNALYDIIMKLKTYGTEEQRKAATALLITIEKPTKKAPMTTQEIREFYRELYGFPN